MASNRTSGGIAERTAVSLLRVMLEDCLRVLRSDEYSLDARAIAQRVVRNILTWNGEHGPLTVTAADRRDAFGSITVVR